MVGKFIARVRAAFLVLIGVRPVEVSFDELDERIAGWCAAEAADTITGRFIPAGDDFARVNAMFQQVSQLGYEAIREYASWEANQGPACCKELRQERINPARREKEDFYIPF
jgi:hypothetical protein